MPKRKGLPEWGELVLCTVERITPYAAWCKLEEYPEIDEYIGVVEDHGSLSADQQLELTKKVSEFLKGQS